MKKMVKVQTPSGTNEYKLISAFTKDNDSYVVLDSGKKDANGYTIVYVCKNTDNNLAYLEGEEWDKAKRDLISAVKNDGVELISIGEEFSASENVGHQISLKEANLNALDNAYVEILNNDSLNMAEEIKNDLNALDIPIVNEMQSESQDNVSKESSQSELENAIERATDANIATEPIAENLQQTAANMPETVEQTQGQSVQQIEEPQFVQEQPVVMDNPVVNDVPVNQSPVEQTAVVDTPVPTEPVAEVVTEPQPEVVPEVQSLEEQPVVMDAPVINDTPIEQTAVVDTPVSVDPVAEVVTEPQPEIVPEVQSLEEQPVVMDAPVINDTPVEQAPVVDTPVPTEPVAEVVTEPQPEIVPEVQSLEEQPVVMDAPVINDTPIEQAPVVDTPIPTEPVAEVVTEPQSEVVPEVQSLEEQPVVMDAPVINDTPIEQTAEVDTPIPTEPVAEVVTEPQSEVVPEVSNIPMVNENTLQEQQTTIASASIQAELDEIEQLKTNIINLCDRLKEKEKEIQVKLEEADAKLYIANNAFKNSQALNDNNDTISIQDYQPENIDQGQARVLAA